MGTHSVGYDWKYALGLELTSEGFDASVLSEFRSRLRLGDVEQLLFETMLTRLREVGLLKARGRMRTDSTPIVGAIRELNRLECVGESLRQALNLLATVAPGWLQSWVPTDWFDRYAHRFEEYRLPPGRDERYALAEVIGSDGFHLMERVYVPGAPAWLREIPAIDILRQVWLQQCVVMDGCLRWRSADDLPPATQLISSPYDPEARYSRKRETEWVGYKVHLTETCDPDLPHLIANVETTAAPVSDFELPPSIHAKLEARDLLPSEHLLDAGYMTADHLVTSRDDYGVDLVGPVAGENSWQTKAGEGFDIASFVIDWEARSARCPQGHTSAQWLTGQHDRHQHPVVHIRFAAAACRACPVRARCTKSASQPRSLTVRTQDAFEALQAARQRQTSESFRQLYALRAGIEGTISQAVAIPDLRHARYIGQAKTHLQHICVALGLNILRVGAWLAKIPRARTRTSPFAALAPAGRLSLAASEFASGILSMGSTLLPYKPKLAWCAAAPGAGLVLMGILG
ncbi:MAG: transposase [Ardenticatenaceae bacterium]|nr:transposase [Ardenticatenaceae bacterium]